MAVNKHKITYEQYCCVLKHNIVFEETVYHNGVHEIRCTNFSECKQKGGCKNSILNGRIKNYITSDN